MLLVLLATTVPAVRPAAGGALDGFVLFAGDGLRAKRLTVAAGDVGGGGSVLATRLDARTSRIYAPAVRLKGAARCAELHANSARGAGDGCPLTGPLAADPVGDVATACAFPQPFGRCDPGAPVTVRRGRKTTLAPGAHGTVRLAAGATLVLDGAYTFCEIVAHRKSRIEAAAGSEIRVTDGIALGTLRAPGADLVVAGPHVKLAARTTVEADVCAPRADATASRVTLLGSLAARTLRLARVTATLAAGAPTTTSSTTTTTLPPIPPSGYLDFVVEDHTAEACGTVSPGTCPNRLLGNPTASLSCSGLNTGSVGAIVTAESSIPPGGVLRLGVAGCVDDVCQIVANPITSPGEFDCSTTGCLFGPPSPVEIILSACLVTRFSAPVSGTVDLATGVATVNAPTATDIHLGQTCPICDTGGAVGTPTSPATGTCNAGATPGAPCTTTNAANLSAQCLPGSAVLATVPGNIALTTGTSTLSAADGLLCPGQTAAGCFGNAACTAITMTGASPGPLKDEQLHPARLVSAYCIPSVEPTLVDPNAGFPGPGTVAVSGQARFFEAAPVTTTSTTATTTTTVATTTTTTGASTTTTTLIPLVTHFATVAANTNASTTSILKPMGGIPAGSSILVVFATEPSTNVTGVNDGVAYTLESQQTRGTGTNGVRVTIWARHDIPSTSTSTIVVSHDATGKRLVNAFYVRNLATTAPLDAVVGTTGLSAAPATGTPAGSPAFSRELFLAAFGIEVGTGATFTPSGGWTHDPTTAARVSGMSLFVEYRIVNPATTFMNAVTGITGGLQDFAAIQHTYEGR